MNRSGPTTNWKFRGWRVVGAGALLQAVYTALILQAYGQYAVILERTFGWSKSALSAGYALNRAESALLGPIQGWALDRFGSKKIARTGAVVGGFGLLAFSQVQELWQFFAAFVFVSVGASLSGFLTVTTAVVRWFERNRAKALSLSGMGFAIGGVMVPGIVWLMEHVGWRETAALSAVVFFAFSWFLAGELEGGPTDHGLHVDGLDPSARDDSAKAEGLTEVHFTAKEAMRTRAFWMISLGHMSALFVVGAVLAHLSLYLTSEQDYSLQRASFIAAALPLLQLVGMFIGGWLGDRINKRLIASVAMIGHSLGLLLLAYADAAWMIWTFVILHGLAWGARGPLMQALRADYFGSTSFGSIMGVSSLIVMMGTALGPLVAGILADETGSYRIGFTIIAAFTFVGMIFFVLATPPAPPNRVTESE